MNGRLYRATVLVRSRSSTVLDSKQDANYLETAIREGIPDRDADYTILDVEIEEGKLTFLPEEN